MFLYLYILDTCLQIRRQRLLTHVTNYFLWRIESTLVLVILQKILENLAKHLRVNTHFGIIRIVLINRKVVTIKEIEKRLKHSGRETRIYFIYLLLLKETTIKIRNLIGIRNVLHPYSVNQRRTTPVLKLGIEQAKEHRFEHLVQEISLYFIRGIIEQIVHVMQIAGKPSLTLQEIKEHDATHHLLDIIAHQFIIFLKGCKVLGIWLSCFLLHPFVSLLYVFLTRKEFHEFSILFTVFIKEIIRKSLYREGFLDFKELIGFCP